MIRRHFARIAVTFGKPRRPLKLLWLVVALAVGIDSVHISPWSVVGGFALVILAGYLIWRPAGAKVN